MVCVDNESGLDVVVNLIAGAVAVSVVVRTSGLAEDWVT